MPRKKIGELYVRGPHKGMRKGSGPKGSGKSMTGKEYLSEIEKRNMERKKTHERVTQAEKNKAYAHMKAHGG